MRHASRHVLGTSGMHQDTYLVHQACADIVTREDDSGEALFSPRGCPAERATTRHVAQFLGQFPRNTRVRANAKGKPICKQLQGISSLPSLHTLLKMSAMCGCMRMHMCMCVCLSACMRACTSLRVHVCAFVCMRAFTWVCMGMRGCACACVHACVRVCACVSVWRE